MKRYRLTKLSDNKNALRTQAVEGTPVRPPAVGEEFIILCAPIDKAFDLRQVTTSAVTEIEGDTFKTLNSTYRLEELDFADGDRELLDKLED
jgi:hypothetical protein